MRHFNLFLSLSLLGSVAFAQNQLCNTTFLEGTTAAGVQGLVNQGADANGICGPTESRPLHQALLPNANVSSDVIQALINAGADVTAQDQGGVTPLALSEARFEEAVAAFQMGQITFQQFNQRQAAYDVVNSGLEALSAAYQNLCDTNWWRGASEQSMLSLLNNNPGIDPNRGCNPGNDRPLHIVLRIIEPLTQDTANAIATFIIDIDADVNLQANNNFNETPASLLEVRYDRLRIRVGSDLDEMCQNVTQASVDRYNSLSEQNHEPEMNLYIGIRGEMGESIPIVRARLYSDFFGNPQGTGAVNTQQICEYRRNNRVVNTLH